MTSSVRPFSAIFIIEIFFTSIVWGHTLGELKMRCGSETCKVDALHKILLAHASHIQCTSVFQSTPDFFLGSRAVENEQCRSYTHMAVALEQIQLEKRVLISWQGQELKGTVKYFGLQNQREVVGIDLDEAYGDSDGSLDEKRYFDCPEFHGLFVPPASLLSVDEVEKLSDIDGEHLYFSEVEKFIEMPRCPRKISQMELVLSDAGKNHNLRRKLVQQIKFCRFRSEVRLRLAINCNEETASEIVMACAVNRHIVGLEVDHTWTSKVEQSLHIWPHLRELSLVNMTEQKPDEATLQKIAETLLQAENLEVFTPPGFDSAKVSDSTIAALAKLRFHFPTIRMNTGRQQSLLDCRVAVRAIRNEEAQKRVVSQQSNLMDSYKKGDLVKVMMIFRDLKDVAQQEQNRLLHLLSLLHEKYCNIGGYEFLRELPGDFDTYSGAAVGQAIPDALLAMSSESQVKYVLAEAHYQRETFEEVCKKVTDALDRVKEMRPEHLKSFMEEEGLSEVVCHKRVLKLAGTSHDMRFQQSNYFYNGFPVFCCKLEDKDLFLYRHPEGAWAVAGEVGSSIPLGLLRDEIMTSQKPRLLPLYETGDVEQWSWPGASKLWKWADECDDCHFFFKEVATEESYLVDELQKF